MTAAKRSHPAQRNSETVGPNREERSSALVRIAHALADRSCRWVFRDHHHVNRPRNRPPGPQLDEVSLLALVACVASCAERATVGRPHLGKMVLKT